MANLNKVMLIGNLTREPELRYTPSGAAVCEFTLAINRKYKDKEETVFVGVVAWERKAELIQEYCHKGDPLYVEGRLTQDSWEDKDGNKRSKTKVTLYDMQFLGSRKSAESAPPPPRPEPQAAPKSYDAEDDIPF